MIILSHLLIQEGQLSVSGSFSSNSLKNLRLLISIHNIGCCGEQEGVMEKCQKLIVGLERAR